LTRDSSPKPTLSRHPSGQQTCFSLDGVDDSHVGQAIGGPGRKRPFAPDSLDEGPQGPERPFGVEAVGQEDVDRLQGWIGQQGLIGGIHVGDLIFFGHAADPLRLTRGNGGPAENAKAEGGELGMWSASAKVSRRLSWILGILGIGYWIFTLCKRQYPNLDAPKKVYLSPS